MSTQPAGLKCAYVKDGAEARSRETYEFAPAQTSPTGHGSATTKSISTEAAMAANNAAFQDEGMPK